MANDSHVPQPVPDLRRYASKQTVEAVQLTEAADWEPIAAWCSGWVEDRPDETCLHVNGEQAWASDWIFRYETEDGPDIGIATDEEFDGSFISYAQVLDAVHEQLTGKPFPRTADDLDGIITTEDVANAVWALLHRDLGVSDSENTQ